MVASVAVRDLYSKLTIKQRLLPRQSDSREKEAELEEGERERKRKELARARLRESEEAAARANRQVNTSGGSSGNHEEYTRGE